MENQNDAFNYAYLLRQVKARVLLAQKKAIYTANEEMLSMYWDIGKLLTESQKQIGWGNNVALMQKVKDIKARYWYMIQCLKTVGAGISLSRQSSRTIIILTEH